jgi:hypothetical protein
MNLTIEIAGEEYKLTNDYRISSAGGAVTRSECTVKVEDGQSMPLSLASAKIYNGETLIFSGIISSVDSPNFSTGKENVLARIQIDSKEIVTKNRLISISLDNVYVQEIIQEIYDQYLVIENITVGHISEFELLFENYNCSFLNCMDVMNELADKAGALWYISPEDKLYFVKKTDLETIALPEYGTGLQVSENSAGIRTKQIVVGASEETSLQNLGFTWTANQYTIPLPYQISEVTGITINGTPAGVGILGVDDESTAKTFLYRYGDKQISLNNNATVKPSVGANVTVVFYGYYDIVIEKENESLKESLIAINGTSGIIENILTDETILSEEDATTTASTMLEENGERIQTLTYTVPFLEGTDIGTVWEVNKPELAIVGTFIVIERNISDFNKTFLCKVKLNNKNFASRYGTVLKKVDKKVRTETKVYNTSSVFDNITRPTEEIIIHEPVTCFPAIEGDFEGMAWSGQNLFYPA